MKNKLSIAFLIAITGIICLCTFCNAPKKKETTSEYLNHNDTVKYVGIEKCRSCHNEIYQTFIKTGMGSSFDRATKTKSAADFSKHHLVYDQFLDLWYHPFWEKDSMYIMEYRLSGKDTVHKRIERVDYIVGSGQHTNSHMMNMNGYVYQMPLTWYAQKRKWDLPPGFENGHNVRFSRDIGFECMSCHNALPGYVENSLNKYTTIPNGIDCERCHGPGEVHVKEKLAGIRIDTSKEIDYSIVNPGKLTFARQTDVCQRCHLQGNAILREGKDFSDFRPGKDLADFIEIYMPKYKGRDDEFIMASHAQRLQMSKCFMGSQARQRSEVESQKSETVTQMTCITCHNPHISVKVTGKQVFNNACSNCHNMQTSCTENREIRKLNGDNCFACHMPKSGTIDIPHVTVTDHYIRKPARTSTKKGIKEFAGIYCINNKSSDDLTHAEAYLSYYEKFEGESEGLDSAAFYFGRIGKENVEGAIHLMYLKGDYTGIVKRAVSFQPGAINHPWLCYRVGQSYQNLQQAGSAKPWYVRAVELAPENLDFINKYGTILVELNDINKGIDVLGTSLNKNPEQPEALTNLGFAYLKKGDKGKAMQCYNKALTLDPDMQQTLFNKAALCNMTGDRKEAKKLLRHILVRDPGNNYVKQLLNGIGG